MTNDLVNDSWHVVLVCVLFQSSSSIIIIIKAVTLTDVSNIHITKLVDPFSYQNRPYTQHG